MINQCMSISKWNLKKICMNKLRLDRDCKTFLKWVWLRTFIDWKKKAIIHSKYHFMGVNELPLIWDESSLSWHGKLQL